MATLRYVAFISENPEKLVDFYQRFLGPKNWAVPPKGISPLPMASTILLS